MFPPRSFLKKSDRTFQKGPYGGDAKKNYWRNAKKGRLPKGKIREKVVLWKIIEKIKV